jgi:hypothetical protein
VVIVVWMYGLAEGMPCGGLCHARAPKDEFARFLPRSKGGRGLRRRLDGYMLFSLSIFSVVFEESASPALTRDSCVVCFFASLLFVAAPVDLVLCL